MYIYYILPDDLWELVQLSGVPINREVSKIVSSRHSVGSHDLFILHMTDN